MKTCPWAYVDSVGQDQDCASAWSDQCLHCPLTESLDTTECMNGEGKEFT